MQRWTLVAAHRRRDARIRATIGAVSVSERRVSRRRDGPRTNQGDTCPISYSSASALFGATLATPPSAALSAPVTALPSAAGTAGLSEAENARVDQPTCFGQRATLVGTRGDDVIVGTPRRDVIVARAGNDVARSLAGADVVCGGPGSALGSLSPSSG